MSAETVGSTAGAASRARKKNRSGLWALAFVVVAAAGGFYYWKQSQPEVEQARPLIAYAEIGDVENIIAASGKLEPFKTVAVGAQASGQLQKLYVEVGDDVVQDQLLAEIDARVQQNRVESSEASIRSAREQLEVRKSALRLATDNWERQQMLWKEGATSQQEYDSAYDRYLSAKASLFQQEMSIKQSELSLETDKTQLEYTQIKAPVSGTVVSIEMEEGRTLNASQSSPTVMNIADLSRMTIKAEISEADIGNIFDGMEVYFTTLGSGTRRWYSTLRTVLPVPTVTNNVVTYTGLFEIDNDDGALKPGMTTQVFFVSSAARGVLTVPVGALTFNDNNQQRGGDLRMAAAGGGQGADAEALRAMRARAEGGVEGGAPGGFPQGGAFGGGRGGRGGGGGGFEGGRQGGPGGAGGAMARMGGGGRGGAVSPAPGQPVQPRRATVKVWDEATQTTTEREVLVGLTSRVNAEILSGLEPGEQVVAGVIDTSKLDQQRSTQQQNRNNNDWRGGGFPGGGGFRGGW